MLRKVPQARPGVDRVLQVLEKVSASVEAEQRQRDRRDLAYGAFQVLQAMADELAERIREAAPAAHYTPGEPVSEIRFGTAWLAVEAMNDQNPIPEGAFDQSGWDVAAGAVITVSQDEPRPYLWGANLWYTDLGQGSAYRWWEVPYMTNPFVPPSTRQQPFALEFDELSLADIAASKMMGQVQFAAHPRPVDDEHLEDFCERWAGLLAKAYRGELAQPPELPFSWPP
jgi:hypothetical protein